VDVLKRDSPSKLCTYSSLSLILLLASRKHKIFIIGAKKKCPLVQALRLCTGRAVQCTLVQALRLCTGRAAHRGSRGIVLPFLDHGNRRGERSASRPGRFLPLGKTRYPSYRRLGGSPGPVWTGAENLASTGIRTPDRPARSQSLHRLSYPAHFKNRLS
jgi:hypothetical protein